MSSLYSSVPTEKLIGDIFTSRINEFIGIIPHDWENLPLEKEEEFRKEVSMFLVDLLTETEEIDSEAIACGNEPPKRGGIFNTNLDSLNELVRRLDKITENKNYYGTLEDSVNVKFIVKICSFVSSRAVALMYGKSYDDDDEGADDDEDYVDLYDQNSSSPLLTEAKCVEKILKWLRRIGREDTDRAEDLCGYVQLFTSPDIEDEFITFKDKFLMSLFGVDLFDIGGEDDEVDDDEDYDDDDEDDEVSE